MSDDDDDDDDISESLIRDLLDDLTPKSGKLCLRSPRNNAQLRSRPWELK